MKYLLVVSARGVWNFDINLFRLALFCLVNVSCHHVSIISLNNLKPTTHIPVVIRRNTHTKRKCYVLCMNIYHFINNKYKKEMHYAADNQPVLGDWCTRRVTNAEEQTGEEKNEQRVLNQPIEIRLDYVVST